MFVFLWKLWFYFAVVLCLQVSFGAFMPGIYPFLSSLFIGWFKVFRPNVWLHNLSEVFLYDGLAVIFVALCIHLIIMGRFIKSFYFFVFYEA